MGINSLILDSDGVMHQEMKPIDGSKDALRMLDAMGINYVIATNNARYTPKQQSAIFAKFGLDIPPEKFVTSAEVTARYIARIATTTRVRVFATGQAYDPEKGVGGGLFAALEEQGIEMATDGWADGMWIPEKAPTHVVMGFKPTFAGDTDGIPAVSAILDHGAELIATNADRVYRQRSGARHPANGAAVGFVEAATGVKAKIMGKPHSPMILEALARLGSKSEETAIVGDNLVEDMSAVRMFREATGQNLHSFLVLSGVATRDDASKLLNPPTGIFDNLQAVVKHLEETRNR